MAFYSYISKQRLVRLDLHIGQRLSQRRKALGLTQADLGQKIGLSFQQILKYEKGVHSLSARRLYQLAFALDVPLLFFFDGFEHNVPLAEISTATNDPNLSLVRAYSRLHSPKIKTALANLIKTIAKTQSGS